MLPLLSQSERDEPEQRPSRMSIKRRDGAPAPAELLPTRRKHVGGWHDPPIPGRL
jgi:hypothetical protein